MRNRFPLLLGCGGGEAGAKAGQGVNWVMGGDGE